MSTETERLALVITADAAGGTTVVRQFGQATTDELDKVEGNASQTGGKAGGAFASNFSSQAIVGLQAVQAAVGSFGLVSFVKGSIADAVNLNTANAELAAGLKTTGSAADVTDSQLNALADTLQKSDAIYSGTVKAGEALLFTFQAVQNQAGAGNDIYNRTITVAGALSNVMGKDLNTSVIQLGRALENPAAGMQALSRSGVTLDAQTRATVLSLAKQGDLLGAQKALLDDLEPRYVSLAAAQAKANPSQQFSVAALEAETRAGQDFLIVALPIIKAVDAMLEGFSELPAPMRAVVEVFGLLVAGGAVYKSFLAFSGALSAIGGSSKVAAVGAGELGAADKVATESTVELNAALTDEAATLDAGAGASRVFAVGLDGVAVAQDATTASTITATGAIEEETTAAITLGSALSGVGIGVVAVVGGLALVDKFATSDNGFDKLSNHLGILAHDIDDIEHKGTLGKLWDFHGILQDQRDLTDVNNAIKQTADTAGSSAANAQLNKFVGGLEAIGVSSKDIYAALEPAVKEIDKVSDAEARAAGTGVSLADSFDTMAQSLALVSDSLTVADGIDAVRTAEEKLNADEADLHGTSQTAIQDNADITNSLVGVTDAENGLVDAQNKLSDAYVDLKDAQDKVTTSTDTLSEAQQALALYDSPRGAEERALQLDIINRRVVTTPEEADQKQLDLLQNGDDATTARQKLQDAVTNAIVQQRDALKGVRDAQVGILDAENSVKDATNKVLTAEQAVSTAIEKRKKLSHDAAAAIAGDERKVQEAIITVIGDIDKAATDGAMDTQIEGWTYLIDQFAARFAPGSQLNKDTDAYIKKYGNLLTGTGQTLGQRIAGSGTGIPLPPLGQGTGGPRTNAVAGATVHQTNHFHGDSPTQNDLDYANRQLGWQLGRSGRN